MEFSNPSQLCQDRKQAAFDHMRIMGFDDTIVCTQLKRLLEVFDNNMLLIEADSYIVLIEAILEAQERAPQADGENNNAQEQDSAVENFGEVGSSSSGVKNAADTQCQETGGDMGNQSTKQTIVYSRKSKLKNIKNLTDEAPRESQPVNPQGSLPITDEVGRGLSSSALNRNPNAEETENESFPHNSFEPTPWAYNQAEVGESSGVKNAGDGQHSVTEEVEMEADNTTVNRNVKRGRGRPPGPKKVLLRGRPLRVVRAVERPQKKIEQHQQQGAGIEKRGRGRPRKKVMVMGCDGAAPSGRSRGRPPKTKFHLMAQLDEGAGNDVETSTEEEDVEMEVDNIAVDRNANAEETGHGSCPSDSPVAQSGEGAGNDVETSTGEGEVGRAGGEVPRYWHRPCYGFVNDGSDEEHETVIRLPTVQKSSRK